MKKQLGLLVTVLLFSAPNFSHGQGCETLLMNGVFNTFNSYTGSYSSAQWHTFWCNGTVEKISSSSSNDAGINVGFAKISLGMSVADAREFQRVYQSINCGSSRGTDQKLNTVSVIQKVASPEILNAYVDCKKLQSSGLVVDMSVRSDDRKVFVVNVKYTGAWPKGSSGPRVKKVSFLPNLISTKEGSLQDGVELVNGQTFSMICERSAEHPTTVYVETEVGTFHADLPPTVPPPTDQEKVMAAMPRGTILGWFNPVKVPTGWALCDGNNGTPDLNEKFPLGTITGTLGSDAGGSSTIIPTGTANLNSKDGPKAWDVNTEQHERGMALAYDKSNNGDNRSNKIPLVMNPISLIPPATKIMFIMKL